MNPWTRLCQLAIKRHRTVWAWCGSNPMTWTLHEAQIKMVYGVETYDEAKRSMR
jgi:hypothetical protein